MTETPPNKSVSELQEEHVKKVRESAIIFTKMGAFDPELLREFLNLLPPKGEVILYASRRDDEFVKSGAIIAETQSDPKRYFGVAGLRDD